MSLDPLKRIYRVYPYVSTFALLLLVCFDVAHRFKERNPTLVRELTNRENGSNSKSATGSTESEWINGKIGEQQIEYKLFPVRQERIKIFDPSGRKGHFSEESFSSHILVI